MAQAVLVTQGAANSLAQYGIADGQVPNNWNKRGSIVKAPDHYKQPDVAIQKMREARTSAKMGGSSKDLSGMIGSDPSVSRTMTSNRAQTIKDRGAGKHAPPLRLTPLNSTRKDWLSTPTHRPPPTAHRPTLNIRNPTRSPLQTTWPPPRRSFTSRTSPDLTTWPLTSPAR